MTRPVRAICSQPFQLLASVGGRLRRHVPDFLVAGDRDPLTVVDVKPSRRLDDAAVRFTFGWTRRLADRLGWRFEVFSEPEPRVLANVRFLAGYRRGWQFDAAVLEEAVVCWLTGHGRWRTWSWLSPGPRGHGWRPGRTCCICCGRGGCAGPSLSAVGGDPGGASAVRDTAHVAIGTWLVRGGELCEVVALKAGEVVVEDRRAGRRGSGG